MYLLKSAASRSKERRVIDSVPLVKLEKAHPRTRSVTLEEYMAIRSQLGREEERVVVFWRETSGRHHEAFDLKWRPMVDLRNHLLRLPPEILKEKQPRRVPISWELRQVLLELEKEQLKIGQPARSHGYVFTRKDGSRIRDITRGFAGALKRAGLQDDDPPASERITPHSFRRACITRWTDLGITPDIVKRASGHTDRTVRRQLSAVHGRDDREAFPGKGSPVPALREETGRR